LSETLTGQTPDVDLPEGDVNLFDEVLLIDASPIGRSPRSQPASFLGIFNEIRALFAGTSEAKVRNFGPGQFSFNSVGGGRCEKCAGVGIVTVDMRFLPDVHIKCPDCHGARYRSEILDVKFRGLTIAEVLALTAQDAFSFFRGRTRIQRRLKHMKDVGLEYLQLGQPAQTLSGGESQRLKLAALLARGVRARTLIVLEEPTTGLHRHDVNRLLDCWNQLLAAGHSLVVIEHNLEVIRAADYVIDLGPDSGDAGGQVIAAGPPEAIAGVRASKTGRFLVLQ
jgi:excinuclease ABC subunit A